jgi:uncharacterized membrane protein (UPF0127 family)
MEVLCRLSYSGVLFGARAMIPGTIGAPTPWDDERMRLAASLLLVAVACGSAAARDPSPPTGLSIRTSGGTVTLEVQVADTAAERRTGLMGRESLEPYDGMAFVWDEPVQATFWMKDTLIPLSIAFWDDQGRIISILDMDPCTGDPCPSYGPHEPFVGAVEVGRGTFAMRGVAVGDTVELAVADA